MDIVTDLNVHMTASINKSHKDWLYDLLFYYCNVNQWLVIQDINGYVWFLKNQKMELVIKSHSPVS